MNLLATVQEIVARSIAMPSSIAHIVARYWGAPPITAAKHAVATHNHVTLCSLEDLSPANNMLMISSFKLQQRGSVTVFEFWHFADDGQISDKLDVRFDIPCHVLCTTTAIMVRGKRLILETELNHCDHWQLDSYAIDSNRSHLKIFRHTTFHADGVHRLYRNDELGLVAATTLRNGTAYVLDSAHLTLQYTVDIGRCDQLIGNGLDGWIHVPQDKGKGVRLLSDRGFPLATIAVGDLSTESSIKMRFATVGPYCYEAQKGCIVCRQTSTWQVVGHIKIPRKTPISKLFGWHDRLYEVGEDGYGGIRVWLAS